MRFLNWSEAQELARFRSGEEHCHLTNWMDTIIHHSYPYFIRSWILMDEKYHGSALPLPLPAAVR